MSAQQFRADVVTMTREESRVVDRFAARYRTPKLAAVALGIGVATLEAARDMGRMQDKTRDRIMKALEGMT